MIHNNTQITKFFYDLFKVKGESAPVYVNEMISPVVDVSPIINVIKGASATNATSGTIYTVPADKDFYLYGAQLSMIKDVTATSTISSITVTVEGQAIFLMTISGLTLTPQTGQDNVMFTKPLKIDRGTTITVTNTTAVGNVTARAHIYGYLMD